MGYYVKGTRIADNSAAHDMGAPSKVGKVRFSKTFRTERAAQREADAWTSSGEFAQYGPSDWTAEVLPGRAPRKVQAS